MESWSTAAIKDSIMRINGTYSLRILESVPYNVVCIIVINLALILILALLFGYRFFRALKPITDGIESLSRNESISLAERGSLMGSPKTESNLAYFGGTESTARETGSCTYQLDLGSFTRYPHTAFSDNGICGYAGKRSFHGRRAKEEGGLHPASEPYD